MDPSNCGGIRPSTSSKMKPIKANKKMWDMVQKFGLEHCDLSTMLWNVNFFLRVISLNIDRRNTKSIPIFFFLFTFIMGSCYIYVYLCSMLWFVFVRSPVTGDIIAAVVVFSLGIASEIGIFKFAYMYFHRETLRDLVESYLMYDASITKGTRFHENLLKFLRDVKKRALIFWVVIIGNGIIYVAKPLLLPGRHLTEDKYIVYGLEPMYESPNYEIAQAVMAAGVWICVYLPANVTAFFIVVIGYIEAQILALSEELTLVWTDAEAFYQDNYPNAQESDTTNDQIDLMNEYIHTRLKDIVKRHTVNLSLHRRLERVIRGALAFEFLILIVALISELLAGLENTYLEVPFALMQVSIDCLNGQRLLDASVAFESAVYESKWENFNKRNMRTVLLILHVAQKPLALTAGGITILNFECLMSVFKTIYSAYTTLRTIV